MTDLQLPVQCTAAEYWQQKLVANLSVLLSHWWHRMLFLLQHRRLLLKDLRLGKTGSSPLNLRGLLPVLPKTVNRQRRDCDLNPGPSAPVSSTLTTRLPPSHPR